MTDNIEALIDVIESALESSHEVSLLDELNTLHEDSSPITHDYREFLDSDNELPF